MFELKGYKELQKALSSIKYTPTRQSKTTQLLLYGCRVVIVDIVEIYWIQDSGYITIL